MAESDEWATVETVEDDVTDDSIINTSGPSGIDNSSLLNKIFSVVINTNPWIIFLIGFALYCLLKKFWPSRGTISSPAVTLSAEEILARDEAIETARRRMQEQYDLKAKEAAIKQKEKEELQRQEKIKNLEKYGTILGRSSKTLVAETNAPTVSQVLGKKKPDNKSRLRPEYNPLMGDSSSSGVCFRPARRGGGAGGG